MPAMPHQLHPLVSLRAFSTERKALFQNPLWGSYSKSGTTLPLLTPRPLIFHIFFF